MSVSIYVNQSRTVQVVTSVSANSRADKAGLMVHDKILTINGENMKGMTENRWKRQFTTRQTVALKIQRSTTTPTDNRAYNSTVSALLISILLIRYQ